MRASSCGYSSVKQWRSMLTCDPRGGFHDTFSKHALLHVVVSLQNLLVFCGPSAGGRLVLLGPRRGARPAILWQTFRS